MTDPLKLIVEQYADTFNMIIHAAENGRLALMGCTDKETGAPVATIALVDIDEDENGQPSCNFFPVATMDITLQDTLIPPSNKEEEEEEESEEERTVQ